MFPQWHLPFCWINITNPYESNPLMFKPASAPNCSLFSKTKKKHQGPKAIAWFTLWWTNILPWKITILNGTITRPSPDHHQCPGPHSLLCGPEQIQQTPFPALRRRQRRNRHRVAHGPSRVDRLKELNGQRPTAAALQRGEGPGRRSMTQWQKLGWSLYPLVN